MWKSAKRELPAFGKNVVIAIDGVIQPYVFYADANGNDFSLEYFWASNQLNEGILIEDNHHWMEIPPLD